MKILVTGAAGFLGRAFVTEFSKKDYEVFSLVSLTSKNTKDLPNVFRADIRNRKGFREILRTVEKVDVVIHCAGLAHQFGKVSEENFFEVNVKGTENVLELARNLSVNHFVLISSVAVYGNAGEKEKIIDESHKCQPQSVYARSKFESENIARNLCGKYEIALTILRPATIIGEFDRGNTARLIRAIDQRKFLWIGRGENLKSLVYRNDVAKACLKILEKKSAETEIFNVTGEAVSMKAVVEEIAASLERKIPKIYFPIEFFEKFLPEMKMKNSKISEMVKTIIKWRSEEIFSGKKISETYNFVPETSVLEGLRKQVAAYKAEKK